MDSFLSNLEEFCWTSHDYWVNEGWGGCDPRVDTQLNNSTVIFLKDQTCEQISFKRSISWANEVKKVLCGTVWNQFACISQRLCARDLILSVMEPLRGRTRGKRPLGKLPSAMTEAIHAGPGWGCLWMRVTGRISIWFLVFSFSIWFPWLGLLSVMCCCAIIFLYTLKMDLCHTFWLV